MPPFKPFSAGAIAAVMLASPAAMQGISAARRYATQKHHASAILADHKRYGHARSPALPPKPDLSSQDTPGEVCDHGDNPRIC